MNLHLMLLLLSFKEPQIKELPLQEAPRIAAPIQISFWRCASNGNFMYLGKDNRYHIGWWETV